ncbi:MAG: peptidylprolyl isomerase [Acidimicrobiales bacterium]
MPTEKRQRKRAGRNARLEAERAAAKRAARRRKVTTAVIATVAVFGILLLISQTGGGGDGDQADTTDTTEQDEAQAALYGATPCAPETKPEEPDLSFDSPFEDCLEEDADYVAELTTADGTITVDLLEEKAPGAVNNFVNLARSGFYDGAPFHRVIEGFVAQGGDPVGQPPGTGGPGYAVADELPDDGEYEIGSVAMANSGRDTQGSQFFIVTGPGGVDLPPQYTLFGTVTGGMDAVETIAPGEPPAEPTIIETVEIIMA